MATSGNITFKIEAGDAAEVDALVLTKGGWSQILEAESATLTGTGTYSDVEASGGGAVNGFGDTVGDKVEFASVTVPVDTYEETLFAFDQLNRLSTVNRTQYVHGQPSEVTGSGTFNVTIPSDAPRALSCFSDLLGCAALSFVVFRLVIGS